MRVNTCDFLALLLDYCVCYCLSIQKRRSVVRYQLVLAAALAVVMSTPTDAQTICDTRNTVVKRLAADYREHPTALGLASTGALLEIFATENGATWTATLTWPQGMRTCLMASGTMWDEEPVLPKPAPYGKGW
jgi:hypothetical protein